MASESLKPPIGANGVPVKAQWIRISILVYRKPEISEDQFHHYWANTHPAVACPWLVKHGIQRYTQYHTTPALREKLKLLPGYYDKAVGDYDAIVELLMPDIDCFVRAQEDPYYTNEVLDDEKNFATWEGAKILVGWEEVYVLDGKAVNNVNGKSFYYE